MLTCWSTNALSASGSEMFIVDISYDLACLAKFGKISQGSNRRTRRRSDIFRSANSGRRIWSRSEESRAGKECVSKCRSRWMLSHLKKTKSITIVKKTVHNIKYKLKKL